MPKFTLIAEHTDLYGKPNGHKVTHEFNVDTLDNVLENTDLFLRGCGFVPTGTLDYVQDDYEPEWHTEEFETTIQPTEHSSYYFDTERNK
jgi:hypothetical protein